MPNGINSGDQQTELIWTAVVPNLPHSFLALALLAPAQTGQPAREERPQIAVTSNVRLVLVDAVVRDTKGRFVSGLEAKDFRVWEDGTEQAISDLALEKDSASAGQSQPRYLVFFFDNSTVPVADQFAYRKEAARFATAWAGPGRYMAAVNFFGIVTVAQNFTTAAGPLARAISAVQAGLPSLEAFSGASGSAAGQRGAGITRDPGGCSPSQIIAKTCDPNAPPPPVQQQDAANPGATRGVFDGLKMVADSLASVRGRKALALFSGGFTQPPFSAALAPVLLAFNRANVALYAVKQPGLTSLAEATGGRAISNANDLVSELGRIVEEQEQHYVLAFTPGETPKGCHALRVAVNRPGLDVKARQGYCTSPPAGLLAGDAAGKTPENRAAEASAGNLNASLQLPYFYRGPYAALVNVAMEIGTAGIRFQKVNGKPHAVLNVTGLAYTADGSLAGRFGNAVKIDLDSDKEAAAFTKQPYHYEYQFNLGPGQYNLLVTFSAGPESFGKAEGPLSIEPWDGRRLALSGIAFAKESRPVPDLASALEDTLMEDSRPLIAGARQILPWGSNRFHTADQATAYAEIYEPLLAGPNPPSLGLQFRVVARQTGQQKGETASFNVANFIRAGNPVVPVVFEVPLASLATGSYRLEVKAVHSSGAESALRAVDFEVE